ncbi:restriction endonuclease subunit S [Vibrio parahaemolyticus]|nr:restriction endonuclease subunit S [Vibrio parahaemolyticus]
MSQYQAYPEYKDSGVEWLDVVPAHWNVSKVKHIAPFQVGWTPSTRNDENFIGENLWVNISDLKTRTIVDTAKRISDKAAKEASMAITPKGSLMYSFKLSVGAVSFAGKDMYTNEAIASFLASAKLPLNYLYYALPKFVIENASTNIYGAKILNQELINNALLLAPSFTEAEKIANFLDHETATIDTLIEKQQQLIKLLKEKRQAVISHTVTKGLNPQAPMKDSGVEWLGEVPEHWRPKSIKRLFKQRKQQNNVGYEVLSVYREFGVILKSSRSDNHNKTPDDLSSYQLVNKGCLVINKMKAWQGSLGVSDLEGITSPDYVVYEPIHSESDKFLHFLLRRQEMPNVYRAISNGIRPSQWRIEPEKFEDLVLFLPSLEEQLEVVKAIQKEVLVYEQLINKCALATKLMEERKSALISAAVTGKIDVRNWQVSSTSLTKISEGEV